MRLAILRSPLRPMVVLALVALAVGGCNSTEPNQSCDSTPTITVINDPTPRFDWTPSTCGEPWLSVQDITAPDKPFVWTIVDTDTWFLPPITYGVLPQGHDAGTVQVAPQPFVPGHVYKVTLYQERSPGDNFPVEVTSATFPR